MNIVETSALGRRYGSNWAIRDCTLTIPEGHLVALVGPNGAGKSTLLNIAVGLTAPTAGRVSVLGGHRPGSPAALEGIGFVAQDMPLHRSYSVGDMVHLTRNLNSRFDSAYALHRLTDLGIDRSSKTGRLSGGQRAQLALSLALGRHPRLLLLDEPTAPLDPLARHDFMATVMTAMADDCISVILSSHMLAELERVADYLVVISHGRVRIDGTADDLLSRHRLVTIPATGPVPEHGWEIIESTTATAQAQHLVRLRDAAAPMPPSYEIRAVGMEELAMAYLRQPSTPNTPRLVGAAG